MCVSTVSSFVSKNLNMFAISDNLELLPNTQTWHCDKQICHLDSSQTQHTLIHYHPNYIHMSEGMCHFTAALAQYVLFSAQETFLCVVLNSYTGNYLIAHIFINLKACFNTHFDLETMIR